jgi:hypothetical protein
MTMTLAMPTPPTRSATAARPRSSPSPVGDSMIRRPQPSVRLRLTLTYTTLFLVTGTALLGVSYLLVQQREKGPSTAVKVICSRAVNGRTVSQFSGIVPAPGPEALTLSPAQCPILVGNVYWRSARGTEWLGVGHRAPAANTGPVGHQRRGAPIDCRGVPQPVTHPG